MIGVALKGLAGRKVRALLTAFAVVIGVVDGERHVHPHRHDAEDLRRSVRRLATTRPTPSSRARRSSRARSAARRTDPRRRCSTKVRALPEVEAAGGTVAPAEVNAADIIGADGKAVAQESLGMSIDAANARFSPLKLKTGDWPAGPRAGRDRRRHRREGGTTRAGDTVVIATAGETRHVPDHRHRLLRRRRLARLRQHRRLGRRRPRRRCSTARAATTRVSIAAEDGTSPAELVARGRSRSSRSTLEVKDSAKQAEDDAAQLERGHGVRSATSCSGSA